MPYPTTPLDHSIFEDDSPEYNMKGSPPSVTSSTPLETLFAMVVARKFEVAERMRRELVETGVSIPHHHLFERAVRATLYLHPVESRLETFTNWFTLLPDARDLGKPRRFRGLRGRLFKHAATQQDIIMQFGLIAASKGYGRYIMPQVISTVVRYSPPAIAAKYLLDFEQRAMMWKNGAKLAQRVRGMKRGRHIRKDVYSLAIRTQTMAGRLKDAVDLLQSARDRKISISGFTYLMLMQHLSRVGDEERLKTVKALADRVVLKRLADRVTPASKPRTLATQLHVLRNIIKRDSHTYIPHNELLVFIEEYKAHTSSTRGIALLRRRALRHGPAMASEWALTEMLYHHRRHEYRLVLMVFKLYFHLVGVPRDLVPELKRKPKNGAKFNDGGYMVKERWTRTEKLWPTRSHTALAWNAMIWLKSLHGSHHASALYRELLRQARYSQAPSTEEVAIAAGPSHIVDGAHFMPFLAAFNKERGATRVAEVMGDMMALGIEPTVEHWTIMAGTFAKLGNREQVFRILDSMEGAADRIASNSDAGPQDKTTSKFPAATIATHTNILQCFVQARCVPEAQEVRARIMARYAYVPGQRPQTDRAMYLLDELLVELLAKVRLSLSLYVDVPRV